MTSIYKNLDGNEGPTGPTGPAGTTDHLLLSNIGTNSHATIDSHLASTSNPHSVTAAQAGALAILSNLSDLNNAATARTNLGLVAGGAGDIWIEKAGDTVTGTLDIDKEGDQFILSNSTTPCRTGSCSLASGDLYTLLGTRCAKYTSLNFAINASGNFASRDLAGSVCALETYDELGQVKYWISNNTTGIPTFTGTALKYEIDLANSHLNTNQNTFKLSASVPDSAAAIGFLFNNTVTLSTAGNKVMSIQNNSTEIFHVYGGASASQSGLNIGSNTTSGGGSAIGSSNTASGIYSFTSGFGCTATNLGAHSLGFFSDCSGLYSVALGYSCDVQGQTSVGMNGATVLGSNALGIGSGAIASGSNSIAIGGDTEAYGGFSVALGKQIISQGLRSVSIGTGATAAGNRNSINATVAFFTNDAFPRVYFNSTKAFIGSGVVYAGTDTSVGTELVTNGTFTGSATGWTLGAGWSYSANTVLYNSASGTGTLTQTMSGFTVGKLYRLSYTFTALTGSDSLLDRMTPSINITSGGTFNNQVVPITTKEFFVATSTSHTFTMTPTVTTGPLTATFDTVSIQECLTGQFTISGSISSNNISLGTQGAATAKLHISAGSATASTAPIKLTSGTVMATPEVGAIEFNTDELIFTGTTGTTRKTVSDFSYRAITSDRTLDGSDELVNCTSGTFTVTLPTAVSFKKHYIVKNSGTGAITINTTSSQTIDGAASGALILYQYDSLTFRSDGSNWIIV